MVQVHQELFYAYLFTDGFELIHLFKIYHSHFPACRYYTHSYKYAGTIHPFCTSEFLLNLLWSYVTSLQIERDMGSGGFILTYFAAGIFGSVLSLFSGVSPTEAWL